jgi:type II secretory pathway component PulC
MAPRRKVDRVETAAEAVDRIRKELADAEMRAAQEAEENAKKGPRHVALVTALKEIVAAISDEMPADKPAWFDQIVVQQFPKEKIVGRRLGMSETEIHTASEKGRKAIGGL